MNQNESFYVSDLDGTLLTAEGKLSDYSRKTLERLLNKGLRFTVASARSLVSIREILGDLPLTLPIIEFNGAYVSDYQTGRHQCTHSIGSDIMESLLKSIADHRQIPFVSAFDGERDRLYYQRIQNVGMAYYLKERTEKKDPRLQAVERFDSVRNQAIVCLTIIGLPKELKPLEESIQASHGARVETHLYEDSYCRGWYWLTVHDHRATKDQAIRVLQEQYGFGDKDLVVFGDHRNDLKMFKIAGRSLAVENALPELKGLTHQVIGANGSDSVVRFIEKDWEKGNEISGKP